MATTATDTAETDLKLTPPDPVPAVAPEKAAGLVPVDDKTKTQLEEKVDGFVDDLVAQDVNSPEFGKRVDAITAMGRKEIRDAAGQSNRFLDRPVTRDGQGQRRRRRSGRAAPHGRGRSIPASKAA